MAILRHWIAAAGWAFAAATAQAQTDVNDAPAVEITARKATADSAPTLPAPPATCPVPRDHHPWARFAPGAWRRVRIITETYDDTGERVTRSETLQTERLVDVSDTSYTVETENVVSVGGKTLRGVTQQFTRGILTDSAAAPRHLTELPPDEVTVSGRTLSCKRWRASVGEGEHQKVITVTYCPDAAPYVLRRTRIGADSSSTADVTSETMRVLRLDMPVLFDGDMVSAQSVRVQTVHGANTTERTEIHTEQVPGGTVHASSTERDASGRRVRWSVEELDDYGRGGPSRDPLRRWRLQAPRRW